MRDLSLDVYRGEIFGIAGVDGNGQKELGEVIAGQRHDHGRASPARRRRCHESRRRVASRLGIGYVTDDRIHEGCVAGSSIADNVALKAIGRKPFSNGFWLEPPGDGRRGATI